MFSTDHDLGVIDDEEGEEQNTDGAVHHLQSLTRHKDADNAEYQENDTAHKHKDSTTSEVTFGLEGERCQDYHYYQSDRCGVEHLNKIISSHHYLFFLQLVQY